MSEISAAESESMLTCPREMLKWDVAVFVFDSSNMESFTEAIEMIKVILVFTFFLVIEASHSKNQNKNDALSPLLPSFKNRCWSTTGLPFRVC